MRLQIRRPNTQRIQPRRRVKFHKKNRAAGPKVQVREVEV